MPDPTLKRPEITFLRFAAVTAYLLALALGVSMLGASSGPFWPAAFFLMLAIPVGVFGAYLATLKRIHWLTMWSGSSLVVRWLSGAWLRLLLSIGLAFTAAALLSIRFSVAGWTDLALIGACVCLVGMLYFGIGRWLRSQYQPLYRHGRSLLLMGLIAAGFVSLLDPLVRLLTNNYGIHTSPADVIDQVRVNAAWIGNSSIAQLVAEWGAFWVGWERFILGRLMADPGWLSWLTLILSGMIRLPLYLAVCFSVCAFFVPAGEYKRILLPSRSEEVLTPLTPKRIAWVSATLSLSVLFIYLPLVGVLESSLRTDAEAPAPAAVISRVEQIGDHYFAVGSIDQVKQLSVAKLETHEALLEPVEQALRLGFSMMRANVDQYLDWYYSLPAEWGRVTSLLAGDIDDYLARKLSETLDTGRPFEAFEQTFSRAMAEEAVLLQGFRQRAEEILEARRVDVSPEEEIIVVARMDRDSLLALPDYTSLTTIEQRLTTAAATTGVSGIVAALATRQIILRASSSGAIRAAGAAIARLALVRASAAGSGGLIGGFIGGTLGSVVPVLGTAAGAAIGGAIGGLAVGVGAELLMLKLEEYWSRDEHRDQLIAAIDGAEAELLSRLGRPAL